MLCGWVGLLDGSRVGVFSDLEMQRDFFFCFLTWVGGLGLGVPVFGGS